MRKKYFGLIITFMGLLLFFTINSISVNAEEMNSEEIIMPTYYNEFDQVITPYSEEEYLEKRQAALESSIDLEKDVSLFNLYPKYFDTFGWAEFSNFVWINKGKTYLNPLYVNLERGNRTTGLAVYFYDTFNDYYGKAVFPKYGNTWHVATTDHLPRNKYYKFKLVSESGELAKVEHGNIGYDK